MTSKVETAYIETPLWEFPPIDYAPGMRLLQSEDVSNAVEGLDVKWPSGVEMPENYQVYLKWNPVAVAVWIDEEEEEPNDE